jgi:hypothetical protein
VERPEDDRFDAWDVALDLDGADPAPPWVPDTDDGGSVPPVPPPEGPRREPRPERLPHPHDDDAFSGGPFLLAMLVLAAKAALAVGVLALGARGGTGLAGLAAVAAILLFILPFWIGAAWFGNRLYDR